MYAKNVTCPDYSFYRNLCKHIHATVQHYYEREMNIEGEKIIEIIELAPNEYTEQLLYQNAN